MCIWLKLKSQSPRHVFVWCALLVAAQIAKFMGPTWAHLGPGGPRWAPCWPNEPCYQGISTMLHGPPNDNKFPTIILALRTMWENDLWTHNPNLRNMFSYYAKKHIVFNTQLSWAVVTCNITIGSLGTKLEQIRLHQICIMSSQMFCEIGPWWH